MANQKSENDPKTYEQSYQKLCNFIDSALDVYKHELSMLFYPVFVQMYLDLVINEHEKEAIEFMLKFQSYQEDYYLDDIRKLAVVTKKEQMKGNEFVENFRSSSSQTQFTIRLSRDSFFFLKRFLNEADNSIVNNIIQEHIVIDMYEGVTRSKKQVENAIGGMIGEANRLANKTKVYYGLLKEPELNIQVTPDDDADNDNTMDNNLDGGEKPKKKKLKKEILSKKSRNDPNAPAVTRIPLPELRDIDKIEKINALRESAKRLKLSQNCLPSICFYTLLNSNHSQNMAALCVDISEDSNYIAAGFSNSVIKVWPLTPNKLKIMRSSNELDVIDKEADDVLIRMMDCEKTFDKKVLYGHSGPVYSINFSPDKTLLISCSEDSTIRLWSLQTWTNICCYKGHCFPVWDVKFSPHGYYFASCGHDRTARLWATDNYQPLRLFSGHISDVDCIQFHPNSNYIATGSTDRSVRLWDVLNGQCVRYYTGHKSKIYCVTFTNCGKFVVSAGQDKSILFWHLGYGYLVAQLTGHHDTIYTMSFSRDNNILASAGNDDCINLWDANKLLEELDSEDMNISQFPIVKNNSNELLLGSYRTKSTNILALHFTRRNLLLASGIIH